MHILNAVRWIILHSTEGEQIALSWLRASACMVGLSCTPENAICTRRNKIGMGTFALLCCVCVCLQKKITLDELDTESCVPELLQELHPGNGNRCRSSYFPHGNGFSIKTLQFV
jgi:hypothetical protein